MKSIEELKGEKTHSVKSAGDLAKKAKDEGRAMSSDEQAEFDKHMADSVRHQEQIDAVQATEDRLQILEDAEKSLKEIEPRKAPKIEITHPADRVIDHEDPEHVRYGRTVAFPETHQGREKAYRAGLWVRAMFCKDDAARRKCINMGIGDVRALSETVNTAGGVFVPEELNQAVIDLRVKYGRFRENAQVIPMGRDTMTIPRTVTDMTASFTGENTAITESDADFNDVELTAKKLAILTRMSSELAEDAVIDIADFLARKMAYAFALKEDTVGFTGTGNAASGGIQGIQWIFENDQTLAGSIEVGATIDLFSEITATHISTVMAQLPDYAADNAKFYCSRVGAELMFGRLKAAGGGNTISDLEGRVMQTYLGYPIVTVNVMRKVTTAINNQVMFLFGDLSLSSTLGDSRGISVRTSEERYFDSDQLAIRATERIAIVNHDYGTTTAGDTGPIVACTGSTS